MKNFIIVDLVILIIKVISGLLCHSYSMLASAVLELLLLIATLFIYIFNDKFKGLGVINSLVSFLCMVGTSLIIFVAAINDIKITSLWILLFLTIIMIIRYITTCFYTNMSYQKRKGLLLVGSLSSTVDFVIYGIIILAMILMKISRWVSVLKYADIAGAVLISLYVFYKGIKIIKNSFASLENKEIVINEKCIDEIAKRKEVKSVEALTLINFNGIRYVKCDLLLNDGVSMVDVNSFVITLQDYLLKFAEVVRVNLIEKKVFKPKHAKVRSKKQDARNSRSGNSKTSPKKKNNKSKNTKR